MQKQLRKNIVQTLWQNYRESSWQIKQIETHLKEKGIDEIILDHFALIDLPGPHTGIPYLCEIFNALGFVVRGKDYLPDKQNDFCWMAEENSDNNAPRDVLPQVVVADFRLDDLPIEIRKIITEYAKHAKPSPIEKIKTLLKHIHNDSDASVKINQLIMQYLLRRDWPLPTVNEFNTVKEFNDLLAWVLIFGRQVNHFTLSVHLLDVFTDLADFNQFIIDEVKLELNTEGGIIKGNQKVGIAQGATKTYPQSIHLRDGSVNIATPFVEFVWRYPKLNTQQKCLRWNEYFTGFIGEQATQIIESLY